MLDGLGQAKDTLSRYVKNTEKYLIGLDDKKIPEIYLKEILQLKKELKQFVNNINSIQSNFLNDIERLNQQKNIKTVDGVSFNKTNYFYFPETGGVELDKDLIQEFNYNLNERLNHINLKFIDISFFEESVYTYKEILDSVEKINFLRLDFNKFYRGIKKKYVPNKEAIKFENEFYNFTNDKKKEVEMSFSTFENKVKSVASKYNIASDDLDKIHEIVLQVNDVIKKNYDDLQVIHKNISNLKSMYDSDTLQLKADLEQKIKEIEININDKSQDKLLNFIKEIDETNELIMSDFESIKNTSKKFSEFMKDETSNKLTNDYKNKAEGEMLAYYSFTALSFIIIFIAIMISWNALHTFAEAHIGNGNDYNNLDLIYLSIRLIFSFIIFLSVTYTSRLASKSYIHWKKNEGIYLRLTALKSFIADMSESKKEEIHEKLVDVYFGKDEQDQNLNQKLKDLPNNITQLLGKVVDQTSGVIDSARGNKKENSLKDKPEE